MGGCNGVTRKQRIESCSLQRPWLPGKLIIGCVSSSKSRAFHESWLNAVATGRGWPQAFISRKASATSNPIKNEKTNSFATSDRLWQPDQKWQTMISYNFQQWLCARFEFILVWFRTATKIIHFLCGRVATGGSQEGQRIPCVVRDHHDTGSRGSGNETNKNIIG